MPIYDVSGTSVSKYDVKLTDKYNNDRGYMVVNLDQNDFPILEFTTQGPSLHEQFIKKIGYRNFRIVWLTPTYSVALSPQGEILAKIGDFNPDEPTMKKIKGREDDHHFIHSLIRNKWRKLCKRNQNAINKEWKAIEGGGGVGHVIENGGLYDRPTGNYFEQYVEGFDRTPRLKQIPPNEGENSDNSCRSGCGATAWAILLAHHDLLWFPELLRGSQNKNGQSWGAESQWECYIDRVTMQIADKLDTECDNSTGWTLDSKIEKGFDYLKDDLGFQYIMRSEEISCAGNLWNPDEAVVIEEVHEAILDDKRPVIVKTPDHFSVAVGVLMRYVDDYIESAYVVLNDGRGNIKYTPTWCLEQYWYFQDISNSDLFDYLLPFQGYGPVLLTTKGTGQIHDKLWIFWLDESGAIKYIAGPPGIIPGTSSSPDSWTPETINVNSIFPPAVTYDGRNIYLLYVDENHRIHLMYLSDKARAFEEVDFPDLRTDIRPAIAGGIGDWLTIAFSTSNYLSNLYNTSYSGVQLISTNRDIYRHNAWPTRAFPISNNTWPSSVDYGYWLQVRTEWGQGANSLSMIRVGNDNYLCWRANQSSSALNFRLSRKWEDHFQDPDPLYREPRYFDVYDHRGYPGALGHKPSFGVFTNGTFLVSKGDYEDRVIIHSFKVSKECLERDLYTRTCIGGYQEVGTIEQAAWLTNSINGEPSLGFIEMEGGNHPMLAVAYTDTNNSIRVRLLSIDTLENPLVYTDQP